MSKEQQLEWDQMSKKQRGIFIKSNKLAHNSYKAMISRCLNVSDIAYQKYGGKGITVCDRWQKSFIHFIDDMGIRPSTDYSLDRYPTHQGNYEPGNCRWATMTEQMRNRRVTILINYNGETRPLSEWAEVLGIRYRTIERRYAHGHSPEEILSKAKLKKGPIPGKKYYSNRWPSMMENSLTTNNNHGKH